MEVILAESNKIITIEKAQKSDEIIISEGLLKGQSFNTDDLQKIKAGEQFDCFGHNKIFDETFDPTFE